MECAIAHPKLAITNSTASPSSPFFVEFTSMRLSVHLVALATLSLSSAALCAQEPRATASRPTLVLFLTVDQMRSDYFSRFDKQLTGGLGRLYHGGAFF